ncbi:discoidin domain-containing protein [Paraflavitalea sp. CAU 1676]|uniref:discoidin domain-containing protein n=1 Tax=Paraflavitalea sp. CAU 1676 TaxID=3032598 RepID=UPI0023DB4D2A|nr:discoidin domain-containing protein [Paraflavitalea sp. CAU 1676]MDF2188556.1 discoidin domain-containing protein [Paraflavitalea sp. CAU 1676]
MRTVNYISFIILSLCVLAACNKPEAILFNDKSTAARGDKSTWTATADSETPDGWENTGKASALLDGKVATYWHTDYSVVVPYPHWVLIDMKTSQHIVSVDITNRQAATPNKVGMKKFKIEGSEDGTSFTSLGEFTFAITNDAQPFPVSSAKGYRYLKITALEPQVAGTNHTFLSEIDVYTTK